MKKRVNRKQAAVMIVIFSAVGQALDWGHPAGHSVLYYAVRALVAGSAIAGLTMWLAFAIFSSVEKNNERR